MNNIKNHLHFYNATGNRLILFDDIFDRYNFYKSTDKDKFLALQFHLISFLKEKNFDSMLILYRKKSNHYFRILEKDGYESCLCGNGLRVMADFCLKKGEKNLHFFSDSEQQFSVISNENNSFTADLGPVNWDPQNMRAYLAEKFYNKSLSTIIENLNTIFQNKLGNIITIADVGDEPHLIIKLFEGIKIDTSKKELAALARTIINTPDLFPISININFIEFYKDINKNIHMITFERGVNDFTSSCGTGAVCSAFAIQDDYDMIDKIKKISFITAGGFLDVTKCKNNNYTLSGQVYYLYTL